MMIGNRRTPKITTFQTNVHAYALYYNSAPNHFLAQLQQLWSNLRYFPVFLVMILS